MPTYHSGNDIAVTIDGTPIDGVISFSTPESYARVDVTTAGSGEQFILGLKPGAVSVETYFDASDAELEAAITGGYTVEDVEFEADGIVVAAFDYAYVIRAVNTQGPANQAIRATLTFLNAPAADPAPVS